MTMNYESLNRKIKIIFVKVYANCPGQIARLFGALSHTP